MSTTPVTLQADSFHRVRLFAASAATLAFAVLAFAWEWPEGWVISGLAVFEMGHAAYHIRRDRDLWVTLLVDIVVVSLAIAIFRPPALAVITPVVYLVTAPILLTPGRHALRLVSTAVVCLSLATYVVFEFPSTIEWTGERTLLIVVAVLLVFGPLINWMIKATSRQALDKEQTHRELEAARSRLEDVFRHSPVGLELTEVGPHEFIAANPAFCEFLGYTEEELLGMTIDDVVHPDDLAAGMANAIAVASGELDSFENERRYIRADGRIVWANFSLSVIRDAAGVPLYTIGQVHDISPRKAAEAERDLLLELSLAIAGSVSAEDAMRSVLSGLCAAGGWSVGELWVPNRGNLTRIHTWTSRPELGMWEADSAGTLEAGVGLAGAVADEGKPIAVSDVRADPRFVSVDFAVEHDMTVALGVPVLAGGEVVAILTFMGGDGAEVSASDQSTVGVVIAQLGQALAVKLAEEERDRLAAIVEHTTDLAGFSDPAGQIRYINPAGRNLLGIGPDEDVTKLSVYDLHPPEFAQWLDTEILDALRAEGAWRGETPVLTRDGRIIPTSQVIMAHRDKSGPVAYLSTVARDITAQKLLEAQQDDAIRSKDEFIASVSHELRTPLTAVRGFAEVLQDPDADLGEVERMEMIRTIASEAADVSDIVEDLLVAARANIDQLTITRAAVEVSALAEETANRIRWGDKSIEVALVPAVVSADPLRLRQILRNLMVNALRYGGTEVRVSARQDGDTVIVRVADDGPGIPEQSREEIFAPYQRAHDRAGLPGSVGLGLAVSRRLARLMGGDIVYDHRDGWSVFELHLPAAF